MTDGQRQALASLGSKVEVALDNFGVPSSLTGNLSPRTQADPVAAAQDALRSLGAAFRQRSEDGFAYSGRMHRDRLGQTHVRMSQTYKGLPLIGGELIVHMTDGAIIGVNGRAVADLNVPVQPALTATEAAQAAIAYVKRQGFQNITVIETGQLVVWVDQDNAGSLAYPVKVSYTGPEGVAIDDVFVGALDGQTLGTHPKVWNDKYRKIHDAGPSCPTLYFPGVLIFQEGGSSSDVDAQKAYDYTGIGYDYYYSVHNRNSYDDAGGQLVSTVHVKFDSTCDGSNAAWTTGSPQMLFGDGGTSGAVTYGSFARSLDVVVHELTHGVTQYSSNLIYQSQSGALNEATSDILGVSARFWYCRNNPGACTDDPSHQADWVNGKGIRSDGQPIRYLYDPPLDAYSLDYYPDMPTNCEVHRCSGIGNLAYYLLAQGGSHPEQRTSTVVTGIGLEKAQAIWYRALTVYMIGNETFQNARDDTAQAAADLYGRCGAEWTSVESAWDSVGVPGTWSCADTHYRLTVSSSGAGSGTVTSTPAGIDCGSTCSADLSAGTRVRLTATPAADSVFMGWSGGCSGTGDCTATLNADVSVSAVFNLGYVLTVTKAGAGSGSVISSSGGINCGTTCSAKFTAGAQVTLYASPAPLGSTFAGWSGGCTGTSSYCYVTVSAATEVTATFNTVPVYTVTVTKSGTGTGVVTSSPSGINCGATCSASYNSGTYVSLTASAPLGSVFAGWTGSSQCGASTTCSLTLNGNTNLVATFTQVPTYTLSVSKNGPGSGTVTGTSGINCGSTCSGNYNQNTQVSLWASPATGSSFAGWSGACSGTGTCLVTMDAAKYVTATFGVIPTYALTVTKNGTGAATGSITSSPSGINCGSTCSASFLSGTYLYLTANIPAGVTFGGWGGSCSGTNLSCSLTLNSPVSVTATFNAVPTTTLTVTKTGTGSGTVSTSDGQIQCGSSCSATYNTGTFVTLSASAATGSVFLGWSGPCAGIGSCTVLLNDATSVSAAFDQLPSYTLAVIKAGTGTGSVSSYPSGITCGSTCSAPFYGSTSVNLTASPASGSRFAGWSGACGGMGSCTVPISAAAQVTATFESLPSYLLTVSKNGTGTGTINSNMSIYCGTSCSATVDGGTLVNLYAYSNTGSTFAGWNGACSGMGSCVIAMNAAAAVTATFNLLPSYALSVTKSGAGTGTVTSSPTGISCGANCSQNYISGTYVTLNASTNSNSVFLGWSGACNGTGSCQLTVNSATLAIANFIPRPSACDAVPISPGQTISGQLSSLCPSNHRSGSYASLYTFSATAGQVIRVRETSSFDSYLMLLGPGGDVVASDDDSGGSLNSLITYTVPVSGTYTIEASSLSVSTGSFKVTLEPRHSHDFNGNGTSDILWRNKQTGDNGVWLISGTTLADYRAITPITDQNWIVAGVAEFDGDGQDDILWRNRSTNALGVWFMQGTTLSSYQSITNTTMTDPNWEIAGVGDFNRDGKADIFWRNRSTGENTVWYMRGATLDHSYTLYTISDTNWRVAAVGDFDGDGRTDVLWRHATTGQNAIWLMNSSGYSSAAAITPIADMNWQVAGIADFNGDGKADILWYNTNTGMMGMWFMSGVTLSSSKTLDSAEPNLAWKIVGTGDYDGNGKADLLWRNSATGENRIWFMEGGTWVSSQPIASIGDVNWEAK